MPMPFARPWRHPKTGMYWFRRRVPKDLRPLLGRCEERRTLGTKEPALARTRYLRAAVETDERWALLRRSAAALAAFAPPPEGATVGGTEAPSDRHRSDCRSFRSDLDRVAPAPSGIPSIPTAPTGSVPWRPTFEAYAAEAKLAPSTIKRWAGVLTALEEALGTDDLALVTRGDLIAWKRDLLAAGRDPRTVRDAHIAATKALMNWAVANGRLDSNPAAGIVVTVPDKPRLRDRDFTDDEAVKILWASFGPHDARLSRQHSAARRWIPWLCAYGGARVNEMTQLRGRDVRRDGAIWVIRITPEAGSVKTGRWRDVPLHPHLVEQGFVDFVLGCGSGPLFYDPARGRNGQAAHPIYKKVGERLAAWVRAIGVDDTGVDPNHGWRHRFKTVGRRAGIDPAMLDAIQGHAPRTEGERYGRYPVDVLFEAICRMPRYDVVVPGCSSTCGEGRIADGLQSIRPKLGTGADWYARG
jgi:integrase